MDSIAAQLHDTSLIEDPCIRDMWVRGSVRFAAEAASKYDDPCSALKKMDMAIPRYLEKLKKFGPSIGSLRDLRDKVASIKSKRSLRALDFHIEEYLLGIGLHGQRITSGSIPGYRWLNNHRHAYESLRGAYDADGKRRR